MFCTTMSLPKKADVRNISQMWVKISKWIERTSESRRGGLLTKSHWWSALNSICPGCVKQETWSWVPIATGKCLAKVHLAALAGVSPHIVSLMFPKGPVLLLYEKNSNPASFSFFCTKINWAPNPLHQNKLWGLTSHSHRQPDFQCTSWTINAQQKLHMNFS